MHQTSASPETLHKLPPLPFGMDALEPYISRETLEFHYGKHHRAYVTRLNELAERTRFAAMPLTDVVKESTGPLFNNAAQAWNHSFYWNCLNPEGKGEPTVELAKTIRAGFGSLDTLASQFKSSAAAKFGSGWTWLVRDADGTLEIRNSDGADNPLRWNQKALLVCDVWEHAYYIDYRNERTKYLDSFWNLINWDFVSSNFSTS